MKVKISNSHIGSNAVLVNLFIVFHPGILSLLALFIVELKGTLFTLIFKYQFNTITLFENLKSSCF